MRLSSELSPHNVLIAGGYIEYGACNEQWGGAFTLFFGCFLSKNR